MHSSARDAAKLTGMTARSCLLHMMLAASLPNVMVDASKATHFMSGRSDAAAREKRPVKEPTSSSRDPVLQVEAR